MDSREKERELKRLQAECKHASQKVGCTVDIDGTAVRMLVLTGILDGAARYPLNPCSACFNSSLAVGIVLILKQ